jgi:hypothetical protein
MSAADARDILSALEAQLVALDRIGAHIAAAHVDTAIQHLLANTPNIKREPNVP